LQQSRIFTRFGSRGTLRPPHAIKQAGGSPDLGFLQKLEV